MAFRAFKKLAQKDFTTSKFQDNSEQFNNQLRSVPLLDGRLIEDITVTTAAINVEHKLGREPLGYIIVYQSTDARVWSNGMNDLFIVLDSSSTVTVNLWVF